MAFDKLDKKVQQAAEQYDPVYNEQAWAKMEALLDEHMPQKKEEKRKFPGMLIFVLSCIIAGSILILLLIPFNKKGNNKQVSNTKASVATASKIDKAFISKKSKIAEAETIRGKSNSITDKAGKSMQQIIQEEQVTVLPSDNFNNSRLVNQLHANSKKISNSIGKEVIAGDVGNDISKDEDVVNPQQSYRGDYAYQFISNILWGKNIITGNEAINSHSIENRNIPIKLKKPVTEKKNRFNNSFALNFSAGPDVSGVRVDNIGSFNLFYGAGVSYSFGKKWQVRTGLYAVKKVYGAKPADYHPPSFFYTIYPKLEHVQADCNVNEVPLILSYKLKQTAAASWFTSAGVSSYFMRKEVYDYTSKTPYGQYEHKSYTIKKENKHYFSSLRLSAGYDRKINKSVSISAEPYYNIPLSGVGYGRVKLSSAGMLFSVNVKPFAKK